MENNHICLLPFYAIYYRDDYKYVSSCCVQRPFEILEDKNIKKWWTGKSVQQVRKDFINGKWPESCKICKTQSEAGQETIRDRWHNEFMYRLGASYDDLDIVYGNSKKEPIYIDYMPDNLCNLSCTMCNPGSSTQFEKMVKDLNIDVWPLFDTDKFTANNKVKNIISSNTRRIKINGGEPTISEKIKDIYNYTIDNGMSKDIELQFTTNFTNFNKTFLLLDKFKKVSVTASLDGTQDTYEYIRHPAKWNSVKSNILKFANTYNVDNVNYNFNVTCVWFAGTFFTVDKWLPDMLNFLDQNFNNAKLNINQCQTPSFQSLSIIPNRYKEEINKTINDLEKQFPKHSYVFDKLKFGINTYQFDYSLLKVWQDITKKIDSYKNIDITTLDNRYKELLEYKE